jgi:hypothetical protein
VTPFIRTDFVPPIATPRRHRSPVKRVISRYSMLVTTGTCLWMLALMTPACTSSTEGGEKSPVFDGVTATFTLTRSRIKMDQKLEVHFVFRNRGETTTTFRFFEPSIHARLYAKGEELGLLCPTADFPVHSAVLKPGETYEFTDELYVTQCYHLVPGRYSIRFNYPLRLLADESLRAQYEEKYHHPFAGLVPWDGRDHPFTVVRWW